MTSMHRRGVEPLNLSIWQSLHTERHLELQFKTQIFPSLFLTNLLAAYLQWDCASLFGRWFHLISLSPRSSAQCSIQDTHLRNKRHALQAVPLVHPSVAKGKVVHCCSSAETTLDTKTPATRQCLPRTCTKRQGKHRKGTTKTQS